MSGGDGDGLRLPGAKGAAALELYRQDLLRDPESWSSTIRCNAARALSENSSAADMSFLEFLTKFMPWGKAGRGMTYIGFLIGHALDQMGRGEWHRAETTLCLGLVAMEQSLHDAGRWNMALLLTHLPKPPFHVLQQGMPLDSLRPFGRLADPAWTSAVVAFIKDAAALSELRRKGMGWQQDGEKPADKKGAAKGAAKGDG